jgi:hypothetical protein
MSSLADLPELVGFFSYSREDDEGSKGALSALRDAIHRELDAQLGRSHSNFRLWQDKEAIATGKLWEALAHPPEESDSDLAERQRALEATQQAEKLQAEAGSNKGPQGKK